MKTENTLENKKRFFAQYFGQKILTSTESPHLIGYNTSIHNTIGMEYLELTPLSQITDEDAIRIARICNIGIGYTSDRRAARGGLSIVKLPNIPQSATDYLRSKGYALPYLDLLVDDLIEYKWIKLIPLND